MKAISLHEPWASAIRDGVKKIETRHWSTRYRGELAIHAAKTVDRSIYYPAASLSPGCFVCIVTLEDCLEMTEAWIKTVDQLERSWGDYYPGRFAWIFSRCIPINPAIPARGYRRLWNVELFGR